jgi:hypothetical protein
MVLTRPMRAPIHAATGKEKAASSPERKKN